MLKLLLLLPIILLSSMGVFAETGKEEESKNITISDTTSSKLGYDLQKGTFTFHARSVFMSTINKGDLLDYSALATGAGIGYISPEFKNFHLGFSGFFVFQLFQNNIDIEDPITGGGNRYELLLFDMNDVNNTHDLDRLEELYLTYDYRNFHITLGRQHFESPLLNGQDNRMRPNIFSGVRVDFRQKRWKATGAFFNALTARGTVDWYSMDESFGVYPFGRNRFGQPSDYKGNITTRGIGILGIEYQIHEDVKFQAWNYHADNVFNLAFGQLDFKHKRDGIIYFGGLQGFYQTAVNDGGNENQEVTYIEKDENSFAIGGRLGSTVGKHEFSFNYLHIGDQGRFLFPREWGREHFYASLARERFEGKGGVDATTLRYKYTFKEPGLSTQVGAGYVNSPDINNYYLNKYGLPSYYHFMGIIDYKFSGYFEGLDLYFMAVNKTSADSNVPDRFRLNRVDMWHFNLVLDYRF